MGDEENLRLSLGGERACVLTDWLGSCTPPVEVDDYGFVNGMNLYGCDFSLITLNPDAGIEKAEFGLFQARVIEGNGSKRVENIGKKGLKRWTMESKLRSKVDQLHC